MSLPEPPKTICKKGKMKLPPDNRIFSFVVEEEITYPQSDMGGEKIFYLQKLKFEDGRIKFRLYF